MSVLDLVDAKRSETAFFYWIEMQRKATCCAAILPALSGAISVKVPNRILCAALNDY
jgi:hypothetical protein